MSKFVRAGFFIFLLVFVSREFELGTNEESTVSPVWGYFIFLSTTSTCGNPADILNKRFVLKSA